MTYSRIEPQSVSPVLGAEIRGVDLAGPLPASTIDEIRHALFHFNSTPSARNSLTAFSGGKVPSHSGITGAPGTTPSTTTMGSAA